MTNSTIHALRKPVLFTAAALMCTSVLLTASPPGDLVASHGDERAAVFMQRPGSTADAPAADDERQSVQFRRFALNGLLAPLIDDSEPPRWTALALPLLCDGYARITVDGRPLRHGELVPAAPFSLRWETVACLPFGSDALMLHGPVELIVEPAQGQLSARVDARKLHIVTRTGQQLQVGVFEAFLEL